ncbi:hypothetical protein GTY82_18475 [Streptomyces sp. SID5476]|uniref:Uncharacterized protein n=1 Tax=Streptomyces bottropensis ATCC 25435 TaxID=1054862 RepID=M3DK67_9ACTN|nr:hypothetical protein SBD_1414 [Streptomyces bottropensis ATCC 25435]MZD19179.1 hypothetical protein [Streptomyces sp. SID5476]
MWVMGGLSAADVAEGCRESVRPPLQRITPSSSARDAEAGEEVVEGLRGDGQRVGIPALVALGKAPQ